MGTIFYIIGKSSSGKDTIFNYIRDKKDLGLVAITPYTTRPIRDGEEESVQYHFVTNDEYLKLQKSGKVIESRVYHTVHGDWTYFNVANEDINLDENSYVAIGVLEAYLSFVEYFGDKKVVPVYVEVDDGERLTRALEREKKNANPKYEEMCRRFLADQQDFSEDKIKEAGISKSSRFVNNDLDVCIAEIVNYIRANNI